MALLHVHAKDADIPPAPERKASIEIASRFGRYAFDPALAIVTPGGLPGFPSVRRFGMADLPDPRHDRFKLLQCLDASDPSFLVMPVSPANAPFDADDLDIALAGTGTGTGNANAALLLVVATRKDPDGKAEVTVNMRAPIVLDLANRRARQFVMPNDKYPLRLPL